MMAEFQLLKARDPSIISGVIDTVKGRPPQKIFCTKKLLPLLCNTQNEFSSAEISAISNETTVEPQEKYFQVYLRLKPNNSLAAKTLYSIEKNSFVCHLPAGKNPMQRLGHANIVKKFSFDKIFDGSTVQSTIFNDNVKINVFQFINGLNSTIMSYGASGSGKTYTMLGKDNDPGLIPRSLEYIFKTIPEMNLNAVLKPMPDGSLTHLDRTMYKNELQQTQHVLGFLHKHDRHHHSLSYRSMRDQLDPTDSAVFPASPNNIFSVWVTFFEVYNESIYDLLSTDEIKKNEKQQSLRLGQDSDGNTCVRGVTCLNVRSGEEAYELLQYGMQRIKYAETLVNKHSSRSHCIFEIKLVQSDTYGNKSQISKLCFCDLAGSERTKDTKNKGDRLVESKNINSSLHVLSRCLKSIHDRQKGLTKAIVPYRQSKLTQIFKNALSGKETITMMINVNPTEEMFDITQHVLSFAAIAKSLIMIPDEKKSETRRVSKFLEYRELGQLSTETEPQINHNDTQIDMLLDEIENLKQQLAEKDVVIEKIEAAVRQDVASDYAKIMEENQLYWQKRSEKAVENARLEEKLILAHAQDMKRRNNSGEIEDADYWKSKYEESLKTIASYKIILEDAKIDYNELATKCQFYESEIQFEDGQGAEVVDISDSEVSLSETETSESEESEEEVSVREESKEKRRKIEKQVINKTND